MAGENYLNLKFFKEIMKEKIDLIASKFKLLYLGNFLKNEKSFYFTKKKKYNQ